MSVQIMLGDCRAVLPTLPAESVQCVVTSPPYWGLRDYGTVGQLGLEPTPEEYVERMVGVFRGVRRVLRDDGTLWLNMGDTYNTAGGVNGGGKHCEAEAARHDGLGRAPGLKSKDLVGMPWRLAFALQADGWFLRADIVWAKPNPMPESVTDRPTKAHEYVFLLSKAARYFYDADAVREPASENVPWSARSNGGAKQDALGHNAGGRLGIAAHATTGRNLRSVWTIPSAPFPEAHFATFPPALAQRCILAGTSAKGCCAGCGAPWARQADRVLSTRYPYPAHPDANGLVKSFARSHRASVEITTTGWAPTCACDAGPPIPCTVLDPFAGSGTVGMVAEQLGRHSILIELNPAYCAMAKARTAQLGLFAQEGMTA